MRFEKKSVAGTIEILANDHYVGMPIKVDDSVFQNGKARAGTPLDADGKVASGSDVIGILLYDVKDGNPNATIVVHGFVETQRAETHSGVAVTSDMREALPMIKFV